MVSVDAFHLDDQGSNPIKDKYFSLKIEIIFTKLFPAKVVSIHMFNFSYVNLHDSCGVTVTAFQLDDQGSNVKSYQKLFFHFY